MSAQTTQRVLLVLAAVSALVFGGWIGREEVIRRSERIKLAIDGYDPRDLLSGHYVQFRLVAEEEARAFVQGLRDGPLEFCLERSGGLHQVIGVRNDAKPCRTILRGELQSGVVSFPTSRFYVDERKANAVAQVTRGPDTYLVVTLSDDGTANVVDLVVGGKSLSR